MDKATFEKWLSTWHTNLVTEQKKIILILDNFRGHIVNIVDYPMITFKFLPPSTTSLTQPLDGGIIQSFKAKYLSFFVKNLIKNIDSGHVSKITKKVTLLDALNWVHESWSCVTRETVVNCWCHFGYDHKIQLNYEAELTNSLNRLSLLTSNCCSSDEYIQSVTFNFENYLEN